MDTLHSKKQGHYRPIALAPDGTPLGRRPLPDDNWPYPNQPSTPFDPAFGVKNPKFERHIYIRRDQILPDIDTQIAMLSGARVKEDGTEDNKLTSATETYAHQFHRWIDKYIGKAKTIMSAFVLEKAKTAKMNSISQKEEVDITLLMPEWYDDTVFEQLCDAIHEYIVNGALKEYFIVTLTSKDPVTVDKNQLLLEGEIEIRKLANASKPGTIRKPFKPF